jgi:hypothetical protein
MGSAEALVLVGVENANGGELAPIGQVLGTLEQTTGARVDPAGFTASVQMLTEAGLVEYVAHELGLTAAGRKLIRRAGSTRDRGHTRRVGTLLAALEDPVQVGAPAPSLAEVLAVISGAGLPEEDFGEEDYEDDEYDEDDEDEYDEDEYDEDEEDDDDSEEDEDSDEDEEGGEDSDEDDSEVGALDDDDGDEDGDGPVSAPPRRRRWFHFGGRAAAE